ncbi:MAG TPA: phosphoribosylanthranilate isomerase, partial [Chloroflexota bacterium]|nr:phosphoribosylanthranilate isomerase [Chloroflexota bacterium]
MTPTFLAGTSRPPAASTVRVKICGLRSLEHAVAALDAGADFLGFNFAPVSKRRVDAGVARRAIEACRALPGERLRTTDGGMVGIFVNQPPAVVEGLARACALDMIQLSGDEDAAYCREISLRTGLPVIKAVRLGGVDDAARVAAYTGDGGVTAILADAPVA